MEHYRNTTKCLRWATTLRNMFAQPCNAENNLSMPAWTVTEIFTMHNFGGSRMSSLNLKYQDPMRDFSLTEMINFHCNA